MEIVDRLGLSIAGKKLELALVRALHETLRGRLDVISVSSEGRGEAAQAGLTELFPGRPYTHARSLPVPILGDLVRSLHFLGLLLKWSLVHRHGRRVAVILNSPLGLCLPLLFCKALFGVKPVSWTIDTPFTGETVFRGFVGRYRRAALAAGQRLLKFFCGIMVLNPAATRALRLNIPSLVTHVGFDEMLHDEAATAPWTGRNGGRRNRVAYAGTLTPNKGVGTLLDAFALLPEDAYELHVYGYGPMQERVAREAAARSNVFYHGRKDNRELTQILARSRAVLVNPTVALDPADEFSFPSKLVEYILSGCPVLTTRFKSLPEAFVPFVHLIPEPTPESFRDAIVRVFSHDPGTLQRKCADGAAYIRKHRNWKQIAREMVHFLGEDIA